MGVLPAATWLGRSRVENMSAQPCAYERGCDRPIPAPFPDMLDIPDISLRLYTHHHEWNLDDAEVLKDLMTTDDFNYQPVVTLRLYLSRNPTYFVLNTVVPCVIVTLLSILVFALPTESGEKVSLSVTVLLSYTVLLLIISDVSPRNGDNVPILSKHQLANTVLVPAISDVSPLNGDSVPILSTLRLYNTVLVPSSSDLSPLNRDNVPILSKHQLANTSLSPLSQI